MESNKIVQEAPVASRTYGLFEVIGVELEYMVVGSDTLEVLPVVDKLLKNLESDEINEREINGTPAVWSNELAAHVLEFKVGKPVETLDGLSGLFHEQILQANRELSDLGGILLPGAVHPWMDPKKDFHVWNHGNRAIYDTFNRIFDCRSHGWANLQSTHLNFPFNGDEEFRKLHAAIRMLIPIIPALCASSPYLDGRFSGCMDARMEVYRNNSQKIPAIAGLVVPEPVTSEDEYNRLILDPIATAVAPYDTDKVLESIWVNSRGCIARFDRGSIELRTMDIQECPRADIALAYLINSALKLLVEEKLSSTDYQLSLSTEALHNIMLSCNREAESTPVYDNRYLGGLGIGKESCRAGDIWAELAAQIIDSSDSHFAPVNKIVSEGTLARRLYNRLGNNPSGIELLDTYRRLTDCSINNLQLA